MTAKLYGAEDRQKVIDLLTQLEEDERAFSRLDLANDEMLVEISLMHGDYEITVDELREVYKRRIDDITNTLRNKGIELAAAPGESLPSIKRALDQQHELPDGNRASGDGNRASDDSSCVDENPTWEERMKDNA